MLSLAAHTTAFEGTRLVGSRARRNVVHSRHSFDSGRPSISGVDLALQSGMIDSHWKLPDVTSMK